VTEIAIQDWLKAAVDTAVELGSGVLGFPAAAELPPPPLLLPTGQGSYVPIQGPGFSMHIGLVSDLTDCTNLARALLGLEPEENATLDEVVDAIGELANMLAGGVKSRLIGREPSQQIGLPIFIDGTIRSTPNMETAVGMIAMGSNRVNVLVVRSCTNS
jgi:Chemotaxis phosphatase CheX